MGRYHFVFPRWSNLLLPVIILVGMTAPPYVIFMVAWGFSPKTTDVGYMPTQPVPFSHAVHAGELGIDCRYCHNTVEYSSHAAIPPTQTCMNCHLQVHPESPKLEPLYTSYETGMPVEWIRVHDLLRERVLRLRIRAAPHEVVHQLTVGLRLARAGLAGDDDALVAARLLHRVARFVHGAAGGRRVAAGGRRGHRRSQVDHRQALSWGQDLATGALLLLR